MMTMANGSDFAGAFFFANASSWWAYLARSAFGHALTAFYTRSK